MIDGTQHLQSKSSEHSVQDFCKSHMLKWYKKKVEAGIIWKEGNAWMMSMILIWQEPGARQCGGGVLPEDSDSLR